MKVIVANPHVLPGRSATGRLVTNLAAGLAQAGHDVHVLTSGDPRLWQAMPIAHAGIVAHRAWTTGFARTGPFGRALGRAGYQLSALWAFLRLARRGDVCIVGDGSPFLLLSAMTASTLTGAILINWIDGPSGLADDGETGGAGRSPVSWLMDMCRRCADHTVVPNRLTAQRLTIRGVRPSRITVVHNWAEQDAIAPIDPARWALRDAWGLQEKFVVGYFGESEPSSEVEPVLDAAARLAHRKDIAFLLVCGGQQAASVETEVERRRLSNVIVRPTQPRARLAECLAAADIHLITLRPETNPAAVPDIFYAMAAAGCPMIVVGDPDGETANLVRSGKCGATVPFGDGERLQWWIEDLKRWQVLRTDMGVKARKLFESRFTAARALSDWRRLVQALGTVSGPHYPGERSGLPGGFKQ